MRKILYTLEEIKEIVSNASEDQILNYIINRNMGMRPHWNRTQVSQHISERIYFSGSITSLAELQ